MAKQEKVTLSLPNDVRARLAQLLEGGKGGITAADLVALSQAVTEGQKELRKSEEAAKTEKVAGVKVAAVALKKAIEEQFAGITDIMVRIEGTEEPQIRLRRGDETVVALGLKSGKGGGGQRGKYANLTRKQKRIARKAEKAALADGKSADEAVEAGRTAAANSEALQ